MSVHHRDEVSPAPGLVMITGAGGMLGSAVVEAAATARRPVLALTRHEIDITDSAAVTAVLTRERPALVVNCAAWTDVDGAEADPDGAYAANADGAGNVARAAAGVGARMVHVSTDYVFPGDAVRPYVESDPTGPRSVYGASKLAGEHAVLAASPEHAVVRTSWLFGAGGHNFVDTMLRLADEGRERVSVVTDQLGCPTWTGHLAPALLAMAAQGPSGIVHVAGGGEATWNRLAGEVFAQAGLDVQVLACTSAEYARPAPRPEYSVMVSERELAPTLPAWTEGVRGHLAARDQAAAAISGTRR